MSEKKKNLFLKIAALVLVIVCAVWMFADGVEHIEDTNGADNYALTTITDQDILERKMGSTGMGRSATILNDTVKFSSPKFTGVYEVMWTDVLYTNGLSLEIIDFEVNGGNFRMLFVNDGKIIAEVVPNGTTTVDLGKVEGNVTLVIAGESADFSFRLYEHVYDSWVHLQ